MYRAVKIPLNEKTTSNHITGHTYKVLHTESPLVFLCKSATDNTARCSSTLYRTVEPGKAFNRQLIIAETEKYFPGALFGSSFNTGLTGGD
jgi:hypothetical protein